MKIDPLSKPLLTIYAIFIASIAYLLDPPEAYDLYRHFERISSLKNKDLSTIIESSKSGYYLFDIYAWLINTANLSIHFFPASIVFIAYRLNFAVFHNLKTDIHQPIKLGSITFIFFTFLISINFIGLSSGIRSGLAASWLLYLSCQLYFHKKTTIFIVGSILAFFIHPFSIAISFILIIPLLLPFLKYFAKPIIYLSIIFLLGTNITTYLIANFEDLLSKLPFYKENYLSLGGEWGAAYINTRNINGIIGDYFIARMPIYLAFLYLALVRRISNYYLYTALILISLYLGLFYSYYTLFSRMADFFILLFTLYISNQYMIYRNSFNKRFLLIYFSTLIICMAYHFYNSRMYLSSIFNLS